MARLHHRLDGHEFEQALRVGDGQGSLVCCSQWGRRVGHIWTTDLNWNGKPLKVFGAEGWCDLTYHITLTAKLYVGKGGIIENQRELVDICSNGSLQGSWYQGGGKKWLNSAYVFKIQSTRFSARLWAKYKTKVKICGSFILTAGNSVSKSFLLFYFRPQILN